MIRTYENSKSNSPSPDYIRKMSKMSNESSKISGKKGIAIYLRILMNYFQSIRLVNNIGLKWPYYVRNFLDFYSSAGNISRKTVSIDCLLNNYNLNIKSIYVQTSFSIIFPFLSYLIALLILLLKLRSRKIQSLFTEFIVIVIVSSIFLQPNIIESIFESIVCKKLDQTDYLLSDMSIYCNEKNHQQW